MNIRVKEGSIKIEPLLRTLQHKFGETYKVKKYSKNRIVLTKGKITGAIVTLTKNKIVVVGNFPNPWIYGAFVFSMVFGGVLIPMVLYRFFLHKKMDACGREVGAFVRENYEKPRLAYSEDYLGVDA